MTMLNKIALVFALATALAGALPAFVGTALAQATVPQGECTTNYYGHGSCGGRDSNPSLHHFIPHAAKSGLVGAGFKPAPTPGVREISFLSPCGERDGVRRQAHWSKVIMPSIAI